MRAEELDFDRLVTRPSPGVIALRGGRAVVTDGAASWRLAEELEETVGRPAARAILTRHGYQSGYQEATRLRTYYAWDSDLEWLQAGARALSALGVGCVSFDEVVVDRTRGMFRVVALVDGAYEAAMCKARRAPSAEPVCDRLVGWLTGFGTAFLGDDVLFIEHSCAAHDEAATRCRFEGRLGSEWGEEATAHRALYRREAIGERLASLDREVLAQAVKIQEQELALSAKRRVEEANRLKSEFLANISHELRTPLNSIVGYADLILARLGPKLPETPKRNLERILANAEHLRRLIDSILDISKIEAGRMELRIQATDPRPILDRCLEDARVLIGQKPIELTCTPGALPRVAVDPTRFRQCLLNLLGNAAKFTAAGSIRVEARTIVGRRSGHECGFLALAVIDTGPGISVEDQALIFEPFRQVDASATRAHGGTGLGLAIVRELLTRMGGEVRLVSAVGAGSTFTLVVPLSDAADPSTPTSTPAPVARPPSTPTLEVLLIDDDPDFAALCQAALEGTRLKLLVEADPIRGLALARTRPPAAVLLDLHLPNVDGREVLRLLAQDERTRRVPVVCCSVRDDLPATLDEGASAALCKPVAPEALRELLGRLTGVPG